MRADDLDPDGPERDARPTRDPGRIVSGASSLFQPEGSETVRQARLRGLVHAHQLLNADLTPQLLFQRIVVTAGELLAARYAVLGARGVHGTALDFVHAEATGDPLDPDPPGGRGRGPMVEDARPFRACALAHLPAAAPCRLPGDHPAVTNLLEVPIRDGDTVLGDLILARTCGPPFAAEEQELANALAAIAGLAIKRTRLASTARTSLEWTTGAGIVNRSMVSGQGAPALQVAIEQIQDVLRADLVALTLPSAGGRDLRVDLAVGTSAEQIVGIRVPIEGSRAGTVFSTGEPRESRGPHDLPSGHESAISIELGMGPQLILAVQGHDRIHGVISVARLRGRPVFTGEEVEIARSFATQAAVAIEIAAAQAARAALAVGESDGYVLRQLAATVRNLQRVAEMLGQEYSALVAVVTRWRRIPAGPAPRRAGRAEEQRRVHALLGSSRPRRVGWVGTPQFRSGPQADHHPLGRRPSCANRDPAVVDRRCPGRSPIRPRCSPGSPRSTPSSPRGSSATPWPPRAAPPQSSADSQPRWTAGSSPWPVIASIWPGP